MQRRTPLALMLLALVVAPLCAEEVTITGRVIGPNGEAVEDAHVGVWLNPPHGIDWQSTATDDEGAYVLNFVTDHLRWRYELVASAPGYGLTVLGTDSRSRTEVEAEVVLAAAKGIVSGNVYGPDGLPVSRARVTVTGLGLGMTPRGEPYGLTLHGWEHAPSTETFVGGRFVLGGLPAEGRIGLSVTADGFADFPIVAAGTRAFAIGEDVEIDLQREAVISGSVMAHGAPVSGVELRADNLFRTWWTHADANGDYEFRGLSAGNYMVIVTSLPPGLITTPRTDVTLDAGARRDDVSFQCVEPAIISGTVRWAESQDAAAGVTVAGRLKRAIGVWSARTDEEGRYMLRVPPGDVTISSTPAEGLPVGSDLEIQPGERRTVDLEIHPLDSGGEH